MAPKAKARPHVLITGKAGTTQISRSGASSVVKRELSGVSLTETHQRSRVRGKTRPPQLIPAQDVLSVLQADVNTTEASSAAEPERSDQRKREREERKMQMRVRTQIDTAIAARAKKKRKEELKKAADAREQQRLNERRRADAERLSRMRELHRAAVRDAMRLDREDEPRDGVPGWRTRRVR